MSFDKQKDVFLGWFEANVKYDPKRRSIYTVGLYLSYVSYAYKRNTIPVLSKTFSNLIKVQLTSNDEFGMVLFRYKNHPEIIGIKLDQPQENEINFEKDSFSTLKQIADRYKKSTGV